MIPELRRAQAGPSAPDDANLRADAFRFKAGVSLMSDSTPAEKTTSDLDTLIVPEVFEDEFYTAIVNLARSAQIDTVLEIGSSSGGGSTLAWVEGLRQNPRKPRLFCMEVSRARCAALKERWDGEGFVESFLGSSVRADQFPTPAEVEHFLKTVSGPLNQYPVAEVLAG